MKTSFIASKPKLNSSSKNTASLILSILISGMATFVCIELALSIYLEKFASQEQAFKYASLKQLNKRFPDLYQKSKHTPHRYLGYYPTPGYRRDGDRHNSLGFRGQEISLEKAENSFRIVCLGGSTTYTSHVKDYTLSYPFLLERELRERGYESVEVINSGVNGWSSLETLINFASRILDLNPDLVIVHEGVSDINNRFTWPPEKFRGDNHGSTQPLFTELVMIPLMEHSNVFRIFQISTGNTWPHSSLPRTFSQKPSTYYGKEFERQHIVQEYPKGLFTSISAQEMLNANSFKFFQRNIENLIAIAKNRNIQVILSTMAHNSSFKDDPKSSTPEYRTAFQEINKVIRNIAAEREVILYDFASEFPDNAKYFTDGRHVNEEGSQLKAKLFAHFLTQNIFRYNR